MTRRLRLLAGLAAAASAAACSGLVVEDSALLLNGSANYLSQRGAVDSDVRDYRCLQTYRVDDGARRCDGFRFGVSVGQ